MADNKKTSDETAGGALAGTEEFRGALGGANYKWTAAQLNAFVVPVAADFTPTLGDGAGNLFTLSTAIGKYVIVGGVLVFFRFTVIWTSIGSAGAGQLELGALPVTVGAAQTTAALSNITGLDTTATLNQILAGTIASNTCVRFSRVNDNASPTSLPANGCSATGIIIGSGFYFV